MTAAWLINHYASDPEESASGSRHFSLARRLAERGWTPVIFAASTEHPSGAQREVDAGRLTERVREGVTFRFLRAPAYSSGLARVVNMMAFVVALLRPSAVAGLSRPGVIIGSTVHPAAAWTASVLARRMRVPFVFEIRDLWPQTLIDMGKLSDRGIPARLMRRLERDLCVRAEAIITLLPFANEYLEAHGVPAEKVVWISNGTDIDDFQVDAHPSGEHFTFMYLGSIGRANGVGAVIDGFIAAAEQDPRLRLVIVGDGAERADLERRVHRSSVLRRIEFRAPVPKRLVPKVITEADALVINILDLDVYRYGVSMNKLFDYAASGRPIIIASNARNNLVADADAGIIVSANDAQALGAAMVTMAAPGSDEERSRWGENARNHVADAYDYRVLGDHLDQLLREVVTRFGRTNG